MVAKLAVFAKDHGHEYVPGAAEILKRIMPGDMLKRFTARFESLRKTWKGTSKKEKSDGTGGLLDLVPSPSNSMAAQGRPPRRCARMVLHCPPSLMRLVH